MQIANSNTKTWSVVTDVHGAPGISGWKQLMPGRTLRGAWEAVELARIPPGGRSGLHRHTRTNEIYFTLSGCGEYLLDGRSESMPTGHLAVTAVGSVHGLRNIGQEDVVWLVAEAPARSYWHRVIPPLPGEATSPGEATVNRSLGPVDLDQIGHVDLTPYGVEPLQQVGIHQLLADQSWDLTTDRGEFFGYLLDGAAVITANRTEFPVAAGTGVTLTRGERVTLTATKPTRLFWVRSGLPDSSP